MFKSHGEFQLTQTQSLKLQTIDSMHEGFAKARIKRWKIVVTTYTVVL